jgi:hypothetical protein
VLWRPLSCSSIYRLSAPDAYDGDEHPAARYPQDAPHTAAIAGDRGVQEATHLLKIGATALVTAG